MKIYLLEPEKKKPVEIGEYENNTFTKKVKANHYMRIVDGYGIQECVINKLKEIGCEKIVIEAPKKTYSSKFSLWDSPYAVTKDWGHGKQRFLGVKYMEEVGRP